MVKKMPKVVKIFKDFQEVYFDSSVFIYFFEDNKNYSSFIEEIFDFLEKKNRKIVFSSLLLLEILVDPCRSCKPDIAKGWLEYFKFSPHIEIVDLTPVIAVDGAFLRAKYNIKTPDSIHLATAMQNKKAIFLTNDKALKKVKEVKVVCLDDIITKSF